MKRPQLLLPSCRVCWPAGKADTGQGVFRGCQYIETGTVEHLQKYACLLIALSQWDDGECVPGQSAACCRA